MVKTRNSNRHPSSCTFEEQADAHQAADMASIPQAAEGSSAVQFIDSDSASTSHGAFRDCSAGAGTARDCLPGSLHLNRVQQPMTDLQSDSSVSQTLQDHHKEQQQQQSIQSWSLRTGLQESLARPPASRAPSGVRKGSKGRLNCPLWLANDRFGKHKIKC